MSKQNNQQGDETEQVKRQGGKPAAEAPAPERSKAAAESAQPAEPAPAQSPEEEDPKALLEKVQEELKKQKDLLLRTAAEYDNYRKRTEREKTEMYADAIAAAVTEFLPVADNLERALAQKDCTVEDLHKGVEMVQTQMQGALKKLGVAEIGKQGDPFDPEFHNAVSHIEDENAGENTVAQVFQKGYVLEGKIVRHAMVQVAN